MGRRKDPHATDKGRGGRRSEIARRKDDHLDVVLSCDTGARLVTTGLETIVFEHAALPEMSLADVDLGVEFLGRRLAAPLLISSMTGGPARAAAINLAIAETAQALGIAFAVGSQRIALEGPVGAGLDRSLRARAPGVPLLANFGAAQLKHWNGPDAARRAVEMIDADALIIHLNPLQEAVQAKGDTGWSGILQRIEAVARASPVPVVVKEVGAGISGPLARRLVDVGVAVIDVAGAGGTSWAQIEAELARSPRMRAVAEAFRDWGIPTARAVADVRRTCPSTTIIASGGIRDGLDVARALRAGANIAGLAARVLPAAVAGPEALTELLSTIVDQLRIACFCSGSPNVEALKTATLIDAPAFLPR